MIRFQVSRAGEPHGAAGPCARAPARGERGQRHFLLYGATGSGKTEVYLQAAGEALGRGHGVIVLVPEIALAPQIVGRFRARWGQGGDHPLVADGCRAP